MRSIEEIRVELDNVDKEMIRGCYTTNGSIDTIGLRKKREVLEDELTLARSTLVSMDDELDIYEMYKCRDHYFYYVDLHDTPLIVGYGGVNYGEGPHVIGNVGYEIYRQYRGHGYARKALELLCDVFFQRGMDLSILVVHPGNVASVMTIEGFGGDLVKSSGTKYGTNVYYVDIKQKVLSRQK